MKRYGNLFLKCFSIENLFAAYLDARKGKRSKKDVLEFEKNLGPNLIDLQTEILDETYQPRPYFSFIVNEPKPRLILAPAFRDVVAQHAIYRVIYPIFDRTFIDTSFACRKGKGTHACADYVQNSMRLYSNNQYTLHLDIKKFFYTIDRSILLKLLSQKIKDKKLLKMMAHYTKCQEQSGIPIGNLLSQLYALIYLNPIDHFIKRKLKIKHYARYVDDMLLIGLNLNEVQNSQYQITQFLKNKLELVLSKVCINKIRRGINFVGYRTWKIKRFVRKHSLYQFNQCLKQAKIPSLNSLIAHALKTSTHKFYCWTIIEKRPDLIPSLSNLVATGS